MTKMNSHKDRENTRAITGTGRHILSLILVSAGIVSGCGGDCIRGCGENGEQLPGQIRRFFPNPYSAALSLVSDRLYNSMKRDSLERKLCERHYTNPKRQRGERAFW